MIYLDHHASTPVDARVLDAMLPFFREHFGNAASSSHAFGHRAREAVDQSRAQIASLVGGRAAEIVLTSGATESDNLALKGVAHFRKADGRDRIITQRTEHKAVLDSATRLRKEGFDIVVLDVDGQGRVDLDSLRDALNDRTALVSVMLANNEVGTAHDLRAIGEAARAVGAWVHCDAAQGLGYIPLDVRSDPVDLISYTGHKIYGPKGCGALWVRRDDPRVRLIAEMDGGGHERGMRSGTLNVSGIVGFGAACALQKAEGTHEAEKMRALRARLWSKLDTLEEIRLNGAPLDEPRHPGNLNVAFGHVDGEGLMLALSKVVAVSSGSACTSASVDSSYVLKAIGIEPAWASASIRFGLGRETTEAEIDTVADATLEAVHRLREQSPLWRAHKSGKAIVW